MSSEARLSGLIVNIESNGDLKGKQVNVGAMEGKTCWARGPCPLRFKAGGCCTGDWPEPVGSDRIYGYQSKFIWRTATSKSRKTP